MLSTKHNELLTDLGLTPNQSKLYLGVLSYPRKTIAEVARKLSMDKSSAYLAATELEKQGLIIANSKSRGSTYTASDPEYLRTMYESRKKEVLSQESMVEDLIRDIRSNTYNLQRNPFLKVEKGIAAHIRCMEESLEYPDSIIRERFNLGIPLHQDESYVRWVKNEYIPKRVRSNIRIRELGRMFDVQPYGEIMETTTGFTETMSRYLVTTSSATSSLSLSKTTM